LENAVLPVDYASITMGDVPVVKRKTYQGIYVSFLIVQKKKMSNIAPCAKNSRAD